MFRGSSFHNIDPKGRIIIPTRFRDVIKASGSDDIMITRMDGCLFTYTVDVWNEIEKKILSLAEKSDHIRRFRRVFIGGAFDCRCDKQGRFLIPPSLRQYSEIDREVVLAGVLDHFEIWSREKWEKENALVEEDMQKEEVRNQIAKLGL
ncbi:MAG: division/cell wall cluster transcriptional repressor MraZ [Desulfobacteraceae bacterium]|nr:division/cell wall cluster transcriptional repressor MraZ [Desulfobacteraceae bacterium]